MTLVELGSAIGLALSTVREHKMRSFLTVLGVIIGTGTIIGVEGDGEDRKFTVRFSDHGVKKLMERYANLSWA